MNKLKDIDIKGFARRHGIPVDAILLKYRYNREDLIPIMKIVENADSFKDELFDMYTVPERYALRLLEETGYTIKEALLLLDDNDYKVKTIRTMSITSFIEAVKICSGGTKATQVSEDDYNKMFEFPESYDDEYYDDTEVADVDDGEYEFDDVFPPEEV